MKAHLLLLALAALLSYAIAAPTCIGYKEFADLNTDCRARTDEATCLRGYAFRSANLTVSCVWHIMADTKIVDRQVVYNRHGYLSINGVDYSGTVCSTAVRALLPTSSKGRWGAYMRMLSGPQNISQFDMAEFPRDSFVTSSCTAGQGAADLCKMQNTAPKGFALTPAFKENSVIMDFSTTDKALIEEFNKTSRLSYLSTLKFMLEVEGTRCTDPKKYPRETPAIADKVAFGPSAYILNKQVKPYYLRTFKAYRVQNVTGIDWAVNVTKSMVESGKTTPMISMLMRETDYLKWLETDCTTNCTPPADKALVNSYCKGLSCKRKIRGLGASSGAYRLLVSYPEIASFTWNETFSDTGPVNIWPKFKKQMVKVDVWPRVWALGEPPATGQAESAEPGMEEGAPVPAPAPSKATSKSPVKAPAKAPAPAPAPGFKAEEVVNPATAALIGEPAAAPVPAQIIDPSIVPAAAPVSGQIVEPAVAQITEPVAAPVGEPVAESVAESVAVFEDAGAGVGRSYMPEYDTPMFKPSFDL
jgi:hypothetical protein